MSSANVLANAKNVLADANKRFPTATPGTPQAIHHEYSSAPYSMVKKASDTVKSIAGDDTAAGLKARQDNVKQYMDATK